MHQIKPEDLQEMKRGNLNMCSLEWKILQVQPQKKRQRKPKTRRNCRHLGSRNQTQKSLPSQDAFFPPLKKTADQWKRRWWADKRMLLFSSDFQWSHWVREPTAAQSLHGLQQFLAMIDLIVTVIDESSSQSANQPQERWSDIGWT